MKTGVKLALVAVAVAAVATMGWRGYSARTAQRQAQLAPVQAPVIELAPMDLATAQVRDLNSGLPITGTLKAVNSAVVKARVPGELQGLTVREGDSVRAGQVLAKVEPTEYAGRLRQAQQQADAAQAQVEIAQRQFDTNTALVEKGFISKTALDNSQASLNSAIANYQAARAAADVVQKSLADTVLKAPIDGQISQRLAQPGERVAPEARIVEIVDLSRLEMESTLSPADSVGVRVGQRAQLHIEGVPQPVQASVVRINPSVQAGSRNVLVYLSVAPQPGLRQGLFAQGTLMTAHERALGVPLNAVRTDKPEPYVQVVEGDRIVHRTVQTGPRGDVDGEQWVAVQGVPEGARVLRGSTGVLREGTAVRAAAATPSPPASAASEAQPS